MAPLRYYAPNGAVPATNHEPQRYSEDTAFLQGRRVAAHYHPNAAAAQRW